MDGTNKAINKSHELQLNNQDYHSTKWGVGGWSLEVRTKQFNLNVTSSHTADRVTYLSSSLSKTEWVVIAAYNTQSDKDKVSPITESNTHTHK